MSIMGYIKMNVWFEELNIALDCVIGLYRFAFNYVTNPKTKIVIKNLGTGKDSSISIKIKYRIIFISQWDTKCPWCSHYTVVQTLTEPTDACPDLIF